MIRRWTSLVIAAALMTTATAHSYSNGCLNIDIGSGWRQDSLNYTNIYPTYTNFISLDVDGFGSINTPIPLTNYVENTQYKGLRSWTFGGKAEYKEFGLLARIFGQYGGIYAGHGTVLGVSDPAATVVNSYNFQADRGEVFDFGAALGVPFCSSVSCVEFTFTPLVGWSQSEQHLRQMKQEIFVNSTITAIQALVGVAFPVLGVGVNIPELYSSYQTRWNGLYAGYDLAVELPDTDFVVYTGFEWHWPTFRSRAQYNVAETPILSPLFTEVGLTFNQQKIDYTQKDHGNGFVVRAGGEWFMNRCWSVGLLGYYSRYWINGGYQDATIILPEAIADDATASVGTVNNLDWTSWAVIGSIGYQF